MELHGEGYSSKTISTGENGEVLDRPDNYEPAVQESV